MMGHKRRPKRPGKQFESRPYQANAVAALRRDLAGHKRVLAVSPTGSGKTVIAAMLLQRESRWRKILWLAHRYELVDQAHATLVDLGIDAGIVMAQDERVHGQGRANPTARVQVASVQTIASRGVPDDVDLLIYDEAHRVMADSYQAIAESCARADVLGLTATPSRMDGVGLGEFFNHMHIVAQPSALYADDYLARPRTFSAPPGVLSVIEVGLQGIATVGGDYQSGKLSQVVNRGALIGKVVSESMRIAPGVPKIVFACSVRHSQRLAAEFIRCGVAAAHLDAHTQPQERDRLLASLARGQIEAICNVDVLTEGWDLPQLGAVVIARPTKSMVRFLQMTGRVQRTYGELRPYVIDHGANVQRFNFIPGQDIEWQLARGTPIGDPGSVQVCKSCGAVLERGETVCPACGDEHVYQKSEAELRDEVDVELQEITRVSLDALRARVEDMAQRKGAPAGWIDRMTDAIAGR